MEGKFFIWANNITFHKISALKKITSLFAAMLFTMLAHSQVALNFCTFVNSNTEECVFDNTKFITTPDSTHGRIFMMVRSVDTFGTTNLMYKLYAIDRFGAEVYLNTVIQNVQPDWKNSWQPAVFVSPGKYMVKVYKDETHMLISRGFEFFNN